MLPLELKMNTKVKPEPLPDDVIVIRNDLDYAKLFEHPDCVCAVVEWCGCVENNAFTNMRQLRQVILGDDIEDIGAEAFKGCFNLLKVDLPARVKNIGLFAFESCTSLESVTLPYGLEVIRSGTFSNCRKLKEIHIPSTVTCIESSAFADCTALERVYGGEGLVTIGREAFLNCKSLKSFPFSPSVCHVNARAFMGCPLHLPVTYYHALSPRVKYGNRTFAVPDGVQTIGAFSFGGSKTINRVVLPDSVRNISRYAFSNSMDYVEDGYDDIYDIVDDLPEKMNMPKGYMKQQEQFDAMMALALCHTVWKGMTDERDFASVALFQNDKTARFLAAEIIKEKDRDNPYLEIRKNSIAYMRAQYRHTPGDMLHLAEFMSFFNCRFYGHGLDPELYSFFESSFHDGEAIDSLCREALQCGAGQAVDLFEKYCRLPSGGVPFVCMLISPYEADWLLAYRFENAALIGESDLHYSSGESVPREFVRSMAASSIRNDVLNSLLPGCFEEKHSPELEEYQKAFALVPDEDWLLLLRRNPEHERDLLTMMCRYAADSMLKKLFEHYCRLSEGWNCTEEIVRTNMWLQAFQGNDSFTAKRICVQLSEILEDLEDEEEYELGDWHFDWQDSSGEQNEQSKTESYDDWNFDWQESPVGETGEQSKTESFDGWDDDWEESFGGETGEQSEQSTSEFFDDTYYEEGMDIFGEHYADDEEDWEEDM